MESPQQEKIKSATKNTSNANGYHMAKANDLDDKETDKVRGAAYDPSYSNESIGTPSIRAQFPAKTYDPTENNEWDDEQDEKESMMEKQISSDDSTSPPHNDGNHHSANNSYSSEQNTSPQKEIQALVNNSSKIKEQKEIQLMVNNSNQVQNAKLNNPLIQNNTEQKDTNNQNGLPSKLKLGIEKLSGYSMDDVNVHYNSSKPAQLHAKAYAQGTEIHIAPGEEKHLPHEAWHIAQQKQGKVQANIKNNNININNDPALEKEADVMGNKALKLSAEPTDKENALQTKEVNPSSVFQLVLNQEDLKQLQDYILKHLPDADNREFEDELQNDLYIILGQEYDDYESAKESIWKEYNKLEWQFEVKKDFKDAGPGKKVSVVNKSFNDHKKMIGEYINGEIYMPAFEKYRETYKAAISGFKEQNLNGYKKLKDYVKPFLAIKKATKDSNDVLTSEIIELFSWLIPMHDGTVKGINNSKGLMKSYKLLIKEKTELLKKKEGLEGLPKDAIIRNGNTINIGDMEMGVSSEIITAQSGALLSGEIAESRYLETELNKSMSGYKFIAGHLVANSLGGKFNDENLTPMTSKFNTSSGGMYDSENDARNRLKEGKVIYYKASVQYGNKSKNNNSKYLPTSIVIEVSNMKLNSMLDDTENIRNYSEKENTVIYKPIIWPLKK